MNPDTKVIYANTHRVDVPDDPSFPYKLEAVFQHSEFMRVAALLMFGGSERIIVRGMTHEALTKLATENEWTTHPRLIRLTITGPDGAVVEQHPKPKAAAS